MVSQKKSSRLKNGWPHTPSGVRGLTSHGHRVFVESDAGIGSGFSDRLYEEAGARILDKADDVWGEAEMILKVKEPIDPEFDRMKPGLVLFTYLHLAAPDRQLTEKLLAQKSGGSGPMRPCNWPTAPLPLLAPMSEVAGRPVCADGRILPGGEKRGHGHVALRRFRCQARYGDRAGRRRGRAGRGQCGGRHEGPGFHPGRESRPPALYRRHLRRPAGHHHVQLGHY